MHQKIAFSKCLAILKGIFSHKIYRTCFTKRQNLHAALQAKGFDRIEEELDVRSIVNNSINLNILKRLLLGRRERVLLTL